MRILQLSPVYPPEIGGVQNSVYEVTERMRSLGHQVTVITVRGDSAKRETKDYSLDGVRRIPAFLLTKGDWGEIKFSPTILRELSKVDFDIAHVHTPRKLFAESLTFYRLIAKRKFPFVVSVRLINMSLPPFLRAINSIYRNTIESLVFRSAARVVVQSKAYKSFLMNACRLDENKFVMIPNGVDTTFFNPSPESRKNQQGVFDSNKKVILFVGRLVSQKGLEFLLRALRGIGKQEPKIRLVVVGEGPLRSHFVKRAKNLQISSKVRFLGAVPHKEMPKIYSESDIFVMPSLSESFPNVLLEAMAMKKPIVSTRVGVAPEILKDRETALLVSPREVLELERAILRLLSNEPLALSLGENARKLAENYSWDSVVTKTLSMYEDILCGENNAA